MDKTLGFGQLTCSHCEDCRICLKAQGLGRANKEALIRSIVTETVRRVITQYGRDQTSRKMVPVGVSARHVHLSPEHLAVLFGPDHQLTPQEALLQPGQYAAEETVTVVGPRLRAIQGVRVLGPLRGQTQVELAPTDGVTLGLELPIRASGHLAGSAPIVLVGPKTSIHLKEGAIRANRHIHMHPDDARRFEVVDGQGVQVEVCGEAGLVFNHVSIRVNPAFRLIMHLDTDDANAAGLKCGSWVYLLDR